MPITAVVQRVFTANHTHMLDLYTWPLVLLQHQVVSTHKSG
ncbi:hypothetical protein [Acinetobacter boissieri]|nr:hypothetical protein [Acinetobacter boissieri]